MNKSDSIKELASAFSKAQAAFEGAVKGKVNPAFRSKYADLASVVDAIKPALLDNELSFMQCPRDAENAAKVETILLHSSGEWMSMGEVSVPVTKFDAHGFGSALTYARRYGLLAAFGVAPEDDDGNAAAKAAPQRTAMGHQGEYVVREATPNGPTTPTTGAFDDLDLDVQNHILDAASRIRTLLKRNDIKGAFDEGEQAKAGFEGRENYTTALWSLLDSRERSALKKEGEARKTKVAA